MKTYFPHNSEYKMSFFDWSCLDYEDRLMKLYHDPYSVEGFDLRASVLASYLYLYRPTTDAASPDTETSADIQETLASTMLISKAYISEFMFLMGYRLLIDKALPQWNMKHVTTK